MRNKTKFLIKQKTQKLSFLNNRNRRSINIKNWVGMDVWMFELFIDAQPQKGIYRLNDYKILFYIMN